MAKKIITCGFKHGGSLDTNIESCGQISVIAKYETLAELLAYCKDRPIYAERIFISSVVFQNLIDDVTELKEFYDNKLVDKEIDVVIITNNKSIADTINNIALEEDGFICCYFDTLTVLILEEMLAEDKGVLVKKYKDGDSRDIIEKLTDETDSEKIAEMVLQSVGEDDTESEVTEDIAIESNTYEEHQDNKESEEEQEDQGEFDFEQFAIDMDLSDDIEDENITHVEHEDNLSFKEEITEQDIETNTCDYNQDSFLEEEQDTYDEVSEISDCLEEEKQQKELSDTLEEIEYTGEEDEFTGNLEDLQFNGSGNNSKTDAFDFDFDSLYQKPEGINPEKFEEVTENDQDSEQTEVTYGSDHVEETSTEEDKGIPEKGKIFNINENSHINDQVPLKPSEADFSMDKYKKSKKRTKQSRLFPPLNAKNGFDLSGLKARNADCEKVLMDENLVDINLKTETQEEAHIKGFKQLSRVFEKQRLGGRRVYTITGRAGQGVSTVTALLGYVFSTILNQRVLYVDMDIRGSDTWFRLNVLNSITDLNHQGLTSLAGSSVCECKIEVLKGYDLITNFERTNTDCIDYNKIIHKILSTQDYDIILIDVPVHVLNKLPDALAYASENIIVTENTTGGCFKLVYELESLSFNTKDLFIGRSKVLPNKVLDKFEFEKFLKKTIESDTLDLSSLKIIQQGIPLFNWDYTLTGLLKTEKGILNMIIAVVSDILMLHL